MITIYDLAVKYLLNIYSFVKIIDAKEPVSKFLIGSEHAVGVYINHADDSILLTTVGIHWIKNEIDTYFEYSSIATVQLPEDDQYRELTLIQHDGTEYFLPVLNDTEEELDLYPLYDFLCEVIYWPLRTNDLESIKLIGARDDVIFYLNGLAETFGNWDDHWCEVNSLRGGFPTEADLKRVNIRPELLKNREVWRLIALCFLIRTGRDDLNEDGLPRSPDFFRDY